MALTMLRLTAHSVWRSEADVEPSADGCSSISVNPLPGVTAIVLFTTPKAPNATLFGLPNGASTTASPFTALAAFEPVCTMAPAPFVPDVATPDHWETIHS